MWREADDRRGSGVTTVERMWRVCVCVCVGGGGDGHVYTWTTVHTCTYTHHNLHVHVHIWDYSCVHVMLTIWLTSLFIQLLHVPIREFNWSVQ